MRQLPVNYTFQGAWVHDIMQATQRSTENSQEQGEKQGERLLQFPPGRPVSLGKQVRDRLF